MLRPYLKNYSKMAAGSVVGAVAEISSKPEAMPWDRMLGRGVVDNNHSTLGLFQLTSNVRLRIHYHTHYHTCSAHFLHIQSPRLDEHSP